MEKKEEFLLFEKDVSKRLGWITFNRPEKYNMFVGAEVFQFAQLLRTIERDDDVKVLVLRGAGEHFGSGADIMLLGTGTVGFSRDPNEPPPSVRRRLIGERMMAHDAVGGQLCNMFHFCKPVIAQVQGYCYGQHFTIATGADIVIASEDALFTHPAFRYIVEAWPMGVWWDMLGPHRVAEMVFTGRPFTAEEMYQAGFVNRVVPREKLEEETLEMAQVIALQNIDMLMVFKHYLETIRAIRNDLIGPNMVGCLAHMCSTYMKIEPGDFSVLKETTKKGAKGAIDTREDRYPPRYRLSYKRRSETK